MTSTLTGTWICWYVNSYSDNLSFSIGSNSYNGTCYKLAMDNPDTMRLGVADDGSLALMVLVPDGTAIPITANVKDSVTMITTPQVSTNCILTFGGQPKPPNK